MGPTTKEGAIIDATRCPGSVAWNPPGCRSSSPIMLLAITPVPGSSQPDPSPFEVVMLAALPSASTTLMCVVPPVARRRASAPATVPVARASSVATIASASAVAWAADPGAAGQPSHASSSRSPSATSSPPKAGGGFVSNRWPRHVTESGARSTTVYASRSAAVSRPPPLFHRDADLAGQVGGGEPPLVQ